MNAADRRRRLQILWVTQQVPHFPGPGGEARQFNLLRGLAEDHDVHVVVAARTGVTAQLAELRELGLAVHPVPEPSALPRPANAPQHNAREALQSALRPLPEVVRPLQCWVAPFASALHALRKPRLPLWGGAWDIVQVEQTHLAGLLALCLPPHQARVVDLYDLLADVQWTSMRQQGRAMPARRRAYWLLDWWKLRHYEARVAGHYSRCLVVSAHDQARLQRWAPRARIARVPNGIDVGYFAAPGGDAPRGPAAPAIMFSGTLNYWPNMDAVQFFVQDVLPLIWRAVPEARFLIAGRGPGPAVTRLAADPRIQVCADVPDMRPYLAGADVVVAPLRHGSGTRIKILEAWSMGKAVVATSKGCEGLECRPGEELLVADDAAGLAAAVVRLLRDPAMRQALAAAGARHVRDRFQWAHAVDVLNAVYAEALGR